MLRAAALALALGAILGGLVGWRLHAPPPAPAVRVEYRDRVQVEYRDREVVRQVAGPVRVVTKRVEVPGPAGPTVTVERVVERGPVTTERAEEHAGTVTQDSAAKASVVPAAVASQPRWSLGLGVDDALGARPLRLSAGLRVVGPVWLEAAAVPARGEVGAGLHVTF